MIFGWLSMQGLKNAGDRMIHWTALSVEHSGSQPQLKSKGANTLLVCVSYGASFTQILWLMISPLILFLSCCQSNFFPYFWQLLCLNWVFIQKTFVLLHYSQSFMTQFFFGVFFSSLNMLSLYSCTCFMCRVQSVVVKLCLNSNNVWSGEGITISVLIV